MIGRREIGTDRRQLVSVVRLKPEMIDARLAAPCRYREVEPRIVDHPFGVVVLAYRRLGAEQTRIKAYALLEVLDSKVNVKSLHADLLFEGDARRLPALARACLEGAQDGAQTLARQQFSVRYATSPFIAA